MLELPLSRRGQDVLFQQQVWALPSSDTSGPVQAELERGLNKRGHRGDVREVACESECQTELAKTEFSLCVKKYIPHSSPVLVSSVSLKNPLAGVELILQKKKKKECRRRTEECRGREGS
jgi:hypothetical protein